MSGNLLRRRCCSECGTVIDSGEATLVVGELKLDRALRKAWWKGQSIHLTKQQFEILEMLVQREGRLVQRWAFFISVIDEEVEDRILDVRVCQIRREFRRVDPGFDMLATQWGEGFMWRKAVEQPEQVAA